MLDDAAVDRLTAGLRLLAPPGVVVGARAISAGDVGGLHPVEAEHVERAVAKRRNEYATGRVLLRGLLARDIAIPTAVDRRLTLPDGIRASLAHDADVAVAAVADADGFRALGVDVEPATPLEPAMDDQILRPEEAGLDAHLVFTLKEAVYKAWSGTGGRMLDHHDVSVEIDSAADIDPIGFTGTVVSDEVKLRGQVVLVDGRWLALVAVPA